MPSLEALSFSWLVLSNFDMMALFYLVILYVVVFCSYLLETCYFVLRGIKGVDLAERGGGETLEG